MIENALILAAGTGSRLKPLTDHAPKCLTEINGVPILENTLNNLLYNSIDRCTIVTGYLSDAIQDTIGSRYHDISITYLYNDHYANTNDMFSLWLAREILYAGTVLLEGDIFFRPETLKMAITQMDRKSCYLAGKYNGKENEILITTDSNNKVRSIEVLRDNKAGEIKQSNYMSSGMLIIQDTYGKYFSEWLTEFVNNKKVNLLFDDVLSAYVTAANLYIFEIQHNEWVEVDTLQDVGEAERVFA